MDTSACSLRNRFARFGVGGGDGSQVGCPVTPRAARDAIRPVHLCASEAGPVDSVTPPIVTVGEKTRSDGALGAVYSTEQRQGVCGPLRLFLPVPLPEVTVPLLPSL